MLSRWLLLHYSCLLLQSLFVTVWLVVPMGSMRTCAWLQQGGPLSGCIALQPWRLPSCWHALPLAASSGTPTSAVAAALFCYHTQGVEATTLCDTPAGAEVAASGVMGTCRGAEVHVWDWRFTAAVSWPQPVSCTAVGTLCSPWTAQRSSGGPVSALLRLLGYTLFICVEAWGAPALDCWRGFGCSDCSGCLLSGWPLGQECAQLLPSGPVLSGSGE